MMLAIAKDLFPLPYEAQRRRGIRVLAYFSRRHDATHDSTIAEMVDFGDDGPVNSAEEPVFKVVTVPDSEDARLFVELSSYGADLAEARHALDLAIKSRGEGSELEDAGAYLIAFAVVAYCRTYFPSNVRKPLTDHIAIPDELSDIHRLVGAFRNTTIAHSQSNLATTFPVGVLDAATLRVRDVTATTVSQTLPPPLVERFRELIEAADDLLFEVTEPVRQRLVEQLSGSDLARMIDEGGQLKIVDATDADFAPRTRRRPYPTSHTCVLVGDVTAGRLTPRRNNRVASTRDEHDCHRQLIGRVVGRPELRTVSDARYAEVIY